MPLMLFIGFLQSAQEVLMPILCIKFAGTQNFANAYGMLLLCQGISSLIGPPTLGKYNSLDGNQHVRAYSIYRQVSLLIEIRMLSPIGLSVLAQR
jgi:hypothetical protein